MVLSTCVSFYFATEHLRLDALLSALAHAKGSDLLDPWSIIHPDNSVDSLAEALDPAHDKYYRNLPKFQFLDCLDYYETGGLLIRHYIVVKYMNQRRQL